MTGEVVAGYDGSPHSQSALYWAVDEARLRSLPLVVCHSWSWPYPMSPRDDRAERFFCEAAQAVVDEGVRHARSYDGAADVRPALVKGAPAAGLLNAAHNSALIVVGSRGCGGFDGLEVGSVAAQVSAHATCPVLVIPSMRPPVPASAPIVVGVDGSRASEAALAFALEAAALRDTPSTAICAWWEGGSQPTPHSPPFTDLGAVEKDVRDRFAQFLAPWRDRFPTVNQHAEFLIDSPRRAVIEAAEGACLLVLGDRGIGSSPQMLLGPVTQAALHRTVSPVAVVKAPSQTPGQ